MFYDPRGQVIHTKNPDNTEQRVVLGVPLSLENPLVYAPTPWESYSYDANDLAELYLPPAEGVPADWADSVSPTHYNTPSSSLIDALGRTVRTVDRLTATMDDLVQVVMQYAYDIRGNLLQVTDTYGRTVFLHEYDVSNRPLKTTHLDGGIKTTVQDCMGKPLEERDAKGALVLNAYDILNRPVRSWALDSSTETVTCRQYTEYGDLSGFYTYPNMVGKPVLHGDEAGMTWFFGYDFKGNPLAKARKVVNDATLMSPFGGDTGPVGGWGEVAAWRMDWDTFTSDQFGDELYQTDLRYDALNRVTQMTFPLDVEGQRKVIVPHYNKGGALDSVQMKENTSATRSLVSVERVAYNAKGQRVLIAYGNGIMTRYRYDKTTFRLERMRSERFTKAGLNYSSDGGVKQDLAYHYDLSGNILKITDTAPESGVGGSDSLERTFKYDALYRLLTATGREKNTLLPPDWDETYYTENPSDTRAYAQHYVYDKMGNIQTLQHVASTAFTRNFAYNSGKNTLATIGVGSTTHGFVHDACGNQTSDDGGNSRHLAYDYGDNLKSFKVQVADNEPSQYAQYLYDAGGQRTKKLVRRQGGQYTSTVYIDGIFEHTKDYDLGPAIPDLEVGTWEIGTDAEDPQNAVSQFQVAQAAIAYITFLTIRYTAPCTI